MARVTSVITDILIPLSPKWLLLGITTGIIPRSNVTFIFNFVTAANMAIVLQSTGNALIISPEMNGF